MNLPQTRLHSGIAVVASLAGGDDVLAARKTYAGAVIGSPVGADQVKKVIDTRAAQDVLCDPQPARGDVVRTGAVAGRISAATLAAADRVARYHAGVQAARAAQLLHAELGVDRVPTPRFIDRETA